MRRLFLQTVVVMCFLCFLVCELRAQSGGWEGEWITDRGHLTLTEAANGDVKGVYKLKGSIKGTATGDELKGETTIDKNSGRYELKLSEDGTSFEGKWQRPGYSATWKGWKKDPAAEEQDTADFSGVWLSSWGTMMLEQDGDKVKGSYGPKGWNTIEGTVKGNRLELTWKRIRWSGPAWLEQTKDGKRIFGSSKGDQPNKWLGIKLDGFDKHVEPKAGEMVEGRTENGILYHLRMPDGWEKGQKVDVVVLLHGMNWTTKGMVWVTAKNWPDSIGKKFAILGIQGHSWAEWSSVDDLRFNYTYTDWFGRSTYEGYPFTDRESPYLVMKAMDELTENYELGRWFIGGHSQGGYLTHILHMHFPEKIAGTFPMCCRLIMQSEPDVFDDEGLVENQQETPMVIIHGKKDQNVDFSAGEYSYNRYLAHDFPHVKFLKPSLGHGYDFLPIDDAVEWLDMMTTDDVEALAEYGTQLVEKKKWRDVGTLLVRAKAIKGGKPFAPIWRTFEDAAAKDAGKYLKAIQENRNNKWIDGYLMWQDKFITSKAGSEVVAAYLELQAEHDEKAKELNTDAFKDLRSRKNADANAKWGQIVSDYYASKLYRTTKPRLKKK